MGFCVLGSDFIKNGFTPVDNVFLGGYLPSADATDIKVYFYGLYLAANGSQTDNSIEKVALMLKLTEERVLAAFRYWEEQGIVSISKTHPVTITYNSVKTPLTPVVRYNAREYSTFVEEMARLFPQTVLTPNELASFIELMRAYKMEINAMLMIARYCLDVKGVVGVPYILAVADNWAKQGITTEAEVNAHIAELEQNSEDIRMIFKTLGLRSLPTIEDRQLYLKWTKDYGYNMDAILTACRYCKRKGGMHKLETVMEELRNAGAYSAQEVANYAENKEKTKKLAQDIVTGIGSFYANYDVVVETYVIPWLAKGFEENALRGISRFCFLRNIRTLDAVDDIVERFYKLGILTEEGVETFIARQLTIDASIKEVLAAAASASPVSNRDREFYRTFVEAWGMPHETVLVAARHSAGKSFPMAEINRLLAMLKERGITAPDEAQGFLSSLGQKKEPAAPRSDYRKQNYTRDQLDSVFVNPDEVDLDNLDV